MTDFVCLPSFSQMEGVGEQESVCETVIPWSFDMTGRSTLKTEEVACFRQQYGRVSPTTIRVEDTESYDHALDALFDLKFHPPRSELRILKVNISGDEDDALLEVSPTTIRVEDTESFCTGK